MNIGKYLGHELFIDLGTANTSAGIDGEILMEDYTAEENFEIPIPGTDQTKTEMRRVEKQRVLIVPSYIAYLGDRKGSREVAFIGQEAKDMYGRQGPNGPYTVYRIMSHGTINCEQHVKDFILAIYKKYAKIDLLGAMGSTRVRKTWSAFPPGSQDSAIDNYQRYIGGSFKCHTGLIDQAVAAAIGIGMKVDQNGANMVADFGSGTTDIVVVSNSGNCHQDSLMVAADDMIDAIKTYVLNEFEMRIDYLEAERALIGCGAALPSKELKKFLNGKSPKPMELYGHGTRKYSQIVTPDHMYKAINPDLVKTESKLAQAIEEVEHGQMGYVVKQGLSITGGNSLIPGLEHRLKKFLKLPVSAPPEGATAVIHGLKELSRNRRLNRQLAIHK